MISQKYKKGFTILELLIAVAIIGIVATVSWGELNAAKKRTEVSNACQDVGVLLNKARAYALTGVQGANVVQMRCERNTCRIDNVPDEQPYVLKAASIPDFAITYHMPYATVVDGVPPNALRITSASDTNIFTSLKIDKYKALCQ